MGSEADENNIGLSFEECCRIPLGYLRIFGLDYIFDGTLKKEKLKFCRYFCFMLFVFGVSMSLMVYSMYLSVRKEAENTNIGVNFMLSIFVVWKLLIVVLNQNKFREILGKMKKNFPATKNDQNRFQFQNIYNRQVKFIKIYGHFSFCIVGQLILFLIVSFIRNGPQKIPLLVWLPFDYTTNLKYFLSCSWMLLFDTHFLMCRIVVDWIFYTTLSLLHMECEILVMKISDVMSQTEIQFNDIKSLVVEHQQLNQIIKEITDFFSSILMFFFIEALQLLALTGFYVAASENIQELFIFSMVLNVTLVQTFMPFHFCQKVVDANDRIIDAFYDGKWELIRDKKAIKLIYFVLVASQKSKKITAMSFVKLSHETFRTVSC